MWVLSRRMKPIRTFRSFFFNGAEVLSVLEDCEGVIGFTVNNSSNEVVLLRRDGSHSYECDYEQVYEHGRWLQVIRSVWNSNGECIFSFQDESVHSEDSMHSIL